MMRQINLQHIRRQANREPDLLHHQPKLSILQGGGGGATKLRKKEIIAVLAVHYGKQETDNKNNKILAELLKE
jgi:hypothetical protein